MSSDKKLVEQGKRLSWLLRHGAREEGLAMDAAGWAPLDEVLKAVRLTRDQLDTIVADNNKSRYEIDGRRIRASQGHSLENTPVTQEGLEASWQVWEGDDTIWHGTSLAALDAIAREGLVRGARSHVHLADGVDSKVGKRANVDVLLGVSPARLRAAGQAIFVSPNGVVLVREVPPGCITAVECSSKAAKTEAASITAKFGV